MVRLSAIFVAVCMVLIAGSFGAVLYLWFGLSGAEAAIIALATLTGLALYNTVTTRLRDRGDFSAHISDLSRGTADLARQVAELSRRVAALEGDATATLDKALAATKPLSVEIGELGVLLRQLAETVDAHETALRAQPRVPPAAPVPPAEPAGFASAHPAPAVLSAAARGADPARDPEPAAAPPVRDAEQEAAVAVIREAITANRVDLYLQPIVTLPQRKVRFYEALARLRGAEGEMLLPADFLSLAETHALMPRLDNLIVFRCVQVLRRLVAKNRDVGLFCNLSAATLADSEFFPQLNEFMEANRALAPALVFELTQTAYRSLGPIELESLGALSDRGFRFSMDQVADLRIEPRDLSERGFRFLKVPAALLLNRTGPAASDIYPADYSGLLSRFGIEMIAEKIESEGVVVDILDYDVRYGQGFLFSPPRPVRPEVMQGMSERADRTERADATAREATESARTPVASASPSPAVAEARAAATQRASALAQLARGIVARS